MFKSATLRLTMWYLAIAMFISILFSIALYNVTTSELSRGLASESQNLFSEFPVFENDPSVNFHPSTYYDSSSHRILLRLIGFNVVVFFAAGISSYWLARRTLEPIEEAHEQQKHFTSDVSHELRTPLTAIKMESEVALMNTSASSSDLRNILQSNLEEVSKLEGLINNILRLTQLEADELQQDFQKLVNAELIDEAIKEVGKKATKGQILVKQPTKNLYVFGNRESLIQLLVIVLDNAIKYSPKAKPVNLEAFSTDDQVVWRVTDQGYGIDPDSLKHVFDRFYRADSSRNKTAVGGYGLGLSIGKMIADLHDADITITSEVGKGTTVSLSIPKPVKNK